MNDRFSPVGALVRFCLENRLIVALGTLLFVGWGLLVAPFDWDVEGVDRDPVPVDAIPDIGENQQIVFTRWPGRSPQDVEDQVSYPLTTALLGLPEVKTIRTFSNFGFSSIYIIFKEEAEFYWSRSRILEKLNSLPDGTLPDGVAPALGPDATGLGQVFWYTIEGRDPAGNPAGGWDLQELRSVQDWYVRYGLQGVEGVAEVASVGGFVKEYQIDVDPDAMRAYGVSLHQVYDAVRASNVDVGARTVEVNAVEYVVRGLGFIESIDDLRQTVVAARDDVPVTLGQIAEIELGPALRRGVLDKEGAEAVGGVVVARYGENPLAVIRRVHEKIAALAPGMPQKTLPDGTVSQLTIVPFYDRSGLIYETLGTLETAIGQEVLITVIVVVVMLFHLRSSLLVSSMLPLAVLGSFIGMRLFGVDANIVALSGIAIAIGTIVDVGIVLTESILRHLEEAAPEGADGDPAAGAAQRPSSLQVVHRACTEVGGAVLTAVLTTVISFLPVFAMEGAEGKLFRPLAYTKTFALLASIAVALTVLPPVAHFLLARRARAGLGRKIAAGLTCAAGLALPLALDPFPAWAGAVLVLAGAYALAKDRLGARLQRWVEKGASAAAALAVAVFLAAAWAPLGPGKPAGNVLFVLLAVGSLLGVIYLFTWAFVPLLTGFLRHKIAFLAAAGTVVFTGAMIWLGFGTVFGFVPENLRENRYWQKAYHAFPGLGKEFMPSLDEGSFLLMPTTMPHASIGEALDVLQAQDRAVRAIPEIDSVVGKIGRVDSPLDPAPISMVETVINYKSEYKIGADGRRARFAYDRATGEFRRDTSGELIPDPRGRYFRQWRDEVRSPDDIWKLIVDAASLPGTTSAPKLQPIETRLVMLQSGMRAPMGIKVYGPDLETIERVGLQIEKALRQVPSIEPATVFADRIVGKPYLEIDIDRGAAARYGVSVRQVQDVIEIAVGGRTITTTVEGRERYPVRVRYQRELRGDIEDLEKILVATPGGAQVPLGQLATVRYVRGPQMIKSEDTFLVGYVIFDKKPGTAEVEVVEQARAHLEAARASGAVETPPGVNYRFTGSYENQVRAEKKLRLILPLALALIFLVLYLQFRRTTTALLVFTGVFLAWSGGFILIWLYGQPWFLDLELAGVNLRDLFGVGPINLSVAVWVGFLALFGIATDDGVLMGTFLQDSFERNRPAGREEIRAAVVEAARRRVRPAMMTTATTLLALLPVLTSTGRGADVMVPMAIPTFGGMLLAMFSIFLVPVLYCAIEEIRLAVYRRGALPDPGPEQPS